MRIPPIAFILIFGVSAFAQNKSKTLAEVSFEDGTKHHKYLLLSEGDKPVFKLLFQENRKKPRAKSLSKSQADFIQNEATRIIWNSQYRKPANSQSCTEYANIGSNGDKTRVCSENEKATAMSYGLLNIMSQLFQ